MRHPRLPFPAFLAVALLTGCVTPSPPMWYAERALVRVGGLDYVVFHSGARAEATRVSGAPGLGTLDNLLRAQAAIAAASGCTIAPATLYGDRVMAEAALDCATPAIRMPVQVLGGPDSLR